MTNDYHLYRQDTTAREIIQAFITVSCLALFPGVYLLTALMGTLGFWIMVLLGVALVSGGCLLIGYIQIVRNRAYRLHGPWLWWLTIAYNALLSGVFVITARANTVPVVCWLACVWPTVAVVLAFRILRSYRHTSLVKPAQDAPQAWE